MLRIHLFSIFTITTPRPLNREDTDTWPLIIILRYANEDYTVGTCFQCQIVHLRLNYKTA